MVTGVRQMVGRPSEREHAPYYTRYVSLVPETDIMSVLEVQTQDLGSSLGTVPPGREGYSYAPGKWSIREVVGHIADTERLLGYRAFCISRGEQAPLPGFDENAYVARSTYAQRSLSDLIEEFSLVRRANLCVFEGLELAGWEQVGTANGNLVSVRAVAFVMAGHVRYHTNILRERYAVCAGAQQPDAPDAARRLVGDV